MAHHCSTSSHHGSLGFILILTAHLCLDLPSGLLHVGLPTKPCEISLFFQVTVSLARSLIHSLTHSLAHSLTQSINIINYYIDSMLKLSSRLITKHYPGEVNY